MVHVITKVVGKNRYRISSKWKPSTANKFVKETRRSGIYAKVLTNTQASKVKRMGRVTLTKLRRI